MKDNGGCFLNTFLILGLLALILTVTYRIVFYARYLYLDTYEVVFDWTGGEQDIWVNTDANSWIIENGEYVGWASFQKGGNMLHIRAYQNDSKEDRDDDITIRSGYVKGLGSTRAGLGNKSTTLWIKQKGKRTTYLNASKQTVSFSEYGSKETISVSTDGDSWSVVSCPDWVTKTVSDNSLVLKVSSNNGRRREGIVRLKSDDVVTDINVNQPSSLTISISSIKIGNVYKNGNIETNYGNTLYSSRTMYLKPRINYYGYKAGRVTLYQKLFKPDGRLSTGTSSPSGYSTKTEVYLYEGSNIVELQGWGNERMGHWSSGWYRYEVWYNGKCLASESFYIY